jgi:hypothetical protein
LLLGRSDLPPYREIGPEIGRGYSEVAQALGGQKANAVRINDRGEVIASVAVPIQRLRTVRGALLLSGTINDMIYAQFISALKVSIYVLAIVLLFMGSSRVSSGREERRWPRCSPLGRALTAGLAGLLNLSGGTRGASAKPIRAEADHGANGSGAV